MAEAARRRSDEAEMMAESARRRSSEACMMVGGGDGQRRSPRGGGQGGPVLPTGKICSLKFSKF